ncbi:retrovirus-related pol polyprotein from transposon TNT 1-94 [Tanacetum coccineum]
MNIYNMKLEQFQVNTKFLNSLPPEWSKFVTDVKLVKDLHTTNFDQLYAYLKQHELHANEVCLMRERNQDPLALVANHQMTPPHFNTYQSSYNNPMFQQQFLPSQSHQYGSTHPTQHYSTTCPSTPHAITYPSAPEKVQLVEAQGNGKVHTEEELEFLADPGIAEAKAVLMANLSSYGSDVLSEVPISDNTNNENEIHSDSNIIPYSYYLIESETAAIHDTNSSAQQDALILFMFEQLSNQVTNCNKVNNDNMIANDTLSTKLERYKERVKLLEERQNVDLGFKNESKEKEAKNIDTEITLEKKVKELDNIVCKMGQSTQTVHMLMNPKLMKPQVFNENNLKQALGFQNPFYLKKAQQIRPMLYDGNVIAKETNVILIVDSENVLSHNKTCLINKLYTLLLTNLLLRLSKLRLLGNFLRLSKRFFELEQHCISLKIAMQLNKETFQKNNTSVNQTEPSFDQLFELNNLNAELQAKDITIKNLKTNIKRLNKTSTTNNVKKNIDEIETINIELEHRVTKLIAKNEHLKQTYKQLYDSIKPSRVHTKEQTGYLVNQLNQKSLEITDLNAQLQEKVFVITTLKNDLRKLKGKDIVDNAAQVLNATTITPEMYKLDPVILAPKVKNNREAHEYYLKHTMEQAIILRELLGYVRDTWPDIHKPRVNPSTSASGSKPSGNKNNDRISQTPSSNEKNKVEVQSRKVKSKLNKQNSDSKNVCNEHVKHHVKVTPEHVVTRVYTRRPKVPKSVPNSKPKVAKSMTTNKMEPGTSRGSDTSVDSSSSSLIDCKLSKLLCDLEIAFRKQTCFVCNLKGVDLLTRSRGTNLYSLSIRDMMASSPICLLSKATKTKSWLWHRRLSHLNFGALNHLARNSLVRGLPRIKFEKDHLCSACAIGKSKKKSHKPKFEDTNQEKLYLLHMDLYGPMRVASVNGKKYILFIVDDYSQFTWVKFLASKDEAPDFIIKFLKMIQVRLNAAIRNIRTDNGTKFVNQTLRDYYEQVGISHETSVARTPQQNGVVEW